MTKQYISCEEQYYPVNECRHGKLFDS